MEHAAIEPPPAVEEPPAVDPVLAPAPAPVLAADPAPAVETVEEVIFLAIVLVLSQVYVFFFASTIGEGYVLLRDSFTYATGKGDVLLRGCFAYTTGEGNVLYLRIQLVRRRAVA